VFVFLLIYYLQSCNTLVSKLILECTRHDDSSLSQSLLAVVWFAFV